MARLFDLEKEGYFYTRLANPTNDAVARKICALEGGVGAVLTSSGQAAVFNICEAGDHFITSNEIYGGTFNLFGVTLKKLGISCTFVSPDATDAELEAAFRPNTKLVFGETISNPGCKVFDIERFAHIAHAHGVPVVIDSTFATPYLLRPFEYGADIVVHSATKFIGGHGTTLGGVIIESGKFDWKASGRFASLVDPDPSYHGISFVDACGPAAFTTKIRAILLRDTGATLSPFNAFLLLQGLETLSLRVERHVENTKKVLEYLQSQPLVESINHPSLDPKYKDLYSKYFPNGAGSIFTFTIKGGEAEAKKFIDSLKIFSILANVADVKSLVIHPATTTHSQCTAEELEDQGIYPNTIRLSIGTEHYEDIIWDLDQAFQAIQA